MMLCTWDAVNGRNQAFGEKKNQLSMERRRMEGIGA
jgi:hypothetical protein